MYRSQTIFLIAILLIAGSTFLPGCGNPEPSPEGARPTEEEGPKTSITFTSEQIANMGIEIDTVAVRNVGKPVELPGKVTPKPDQEAYVTSLISGRIEKVMANEGDHVKKGQALATVAGSELGTLLSDLQNARLELNRQQRLMDRGVGIEKQLQDARIAYSSARQRLRAIGFSAEEIKQLADGEQILDAMPLRSPIDGVVLERMAVTGGPVADGDKLFYISNLKPIWVRIDAYERDLEKIRNGQPAKITTPAYPDRTFDGAVDNIVPQINTENRTASVIIELPNAQEELKPGMFTSATVQTGASRQAAVSTDAIQIDGETNFVLIAENDTTFRRQQVGVETVEGDFVAVPDLPPGTRVVTKGAFQIMSAMKGVEAEDE